MSEFHLFARLPPEIRIRIWEMTAYPRLVYIDDKWDYEGVLYVSSSTPCPPVVQVCRESRRYAPYQRAFTVGSDPRYTWTNFEADMICIPRYHLDYRPLIAHREELQCLRVRIADDGSHDYYYYWSDKYFKLLPALRELHLVVSRRILKWGALFEDHRWGSCTRENVRFIDRKSGLMFTGDELFDVADWHKYPCWHGNRRGTTSRFPLPS